MNGIPRIQSVADTGAAEVIEVLEGLLAKARAGELVSITGVAEYRHGEHINFDTASNRYTAAGRLLDAALMKLQA